MPKNVIFSLLCEQHCFMCDFYLHNICRGHFTVELISHLHLHKACTPGFLVLLLIPINAFHLSGRQVCYLRSCCCCSLPLFAAFLWATLLYGQYVVRLALGVCLASCQGRGHTAGLVGPLRGAGKCRQILVWMQATWNVKHWIYKGQ